MKLLNLGSNLTPTQKANSILVVYVLKFMFITGLKGVNFIKSMSQLIYKNGCWGCKRAIEDPLQQYVCPQQKQHLKEYQKSKNYA